MARGKVGDVVFSRLNGEQISRVRNRHPKNPRSAAQLYQRAIMATVAQAYTAGRVIFDHAFQGRAVGEENQRRFLSLNAKVLRSQIAADINGSVAVVSQVGRVVAPGAVSPVPAQLQVSEGSLANPLSSVLPAAVDDETVAQYVARIGLVPGDLFTFVAQVIRPGAPVLFTLATDDTDYSKQFGCEFVFARYQVSDSVFTSTALAGDLNLSSLLVLTDSNFVPGPVAGVLPQDDMPDINVMVAENARGSYAWVRSRVNEDLRSSETMQFTTPNTFGIASQYALAAWQQGTESLGNSDLILEGGDI